MVGYSLGNRSNDESEQEIAVLGEEDENCLLYSRSKIIQLYSYENKKYSSLVVPYSTIKICSQARENGVREANYSVFHRPDSFPFLRSMLDLWGFDNYVSYLYTICELGFLEGLIPVIDFGFLKPDEIKHLYSVAAVTNSPLVSDYDYLMDQDDIRSLEKSNQIRSKVLSWSSKLKFPTSTGFFVHKGQSAAERKDMAQEIASSINDYNYVHEVVIRHIPRTDDLTVDLCSDKDIISIYEALRGIIPEHVPVIVDRPSIKTFEAVLANGEKDFGSFTDAYCLSEEGQAFWEEAVKVAEKKGFYFQQRFPLKREFIQNDQYSKKLGQVFDSYKYKIKKQIAEKLKESK